MKASLHLPKLFCCWQVKPGLGTSVQDGAGAGAGEPVEGAGEPDEGAGEEEEGAEAEPPLLPPPQRPQVARQ